MSLNNALTNKEIIENLLWIQNKQGQKVRFKLNPTQIIYEKARTLRDLILKARQKGFSSFISADQFIDCIKKTINAVIISHETEATKRLFAKVRYFIENLKVRPAMTYETKKDISFPETNSNYYIGTAGQKAVGRGDTIHRAHLSEVAFFSNAKEIIAGISESVPIDGRIVLESTANGRGNYFYDEWQAAKAGQSIYTGHFYPWFIDDEYQLSKDKLTLLGLKESVVNQLINPEFTAEEKNLIKKHNLTLQQIIWRRYKIWDLDDLFFQEYPKDDVSCFLQSGRPVFKRVNMADRPALDKDKQYYGGIDGAEGVKGGDNHCFSLIDPKLTPAKVVYEVTSNDPIDIFCQQVAKICKKYKVILGVEKNGVGVAHCQKLLELGVIFEEWTTTISTRPLLISELEEAYRKDELRETYLEAKNELLDMLYNDKNKPIHPDGKHDDRIFARGIAWQMVKEPIPKIIVI